jgi:hypothetical protein
MENFVVNIAAMTAIILAIVWNGRDSEDQVAWGCLGIGQKKSLLRLLETAMANSPKFCLPGSLENGSKSWRPGVSKLLSLNRSIIIERFFIHF